MSAPTLPDALQSHRQRVVPSSPWFPHGTKIAAKAKHSFGSERFRVERTAKTNKIVGLSQPLKSRVLKKVINNRSNFTSMIINFSYHFRMR